LVRGDNRCVSARCVVFVHAHPDDEALATGGTIARYSAEGAHVCLVTCTNGELGEIAEVPDLGPADEIRPRLGEIRAVELEEACRRLGDIDLRMLGYHDSGMEGTPANDDPGAFINQDIEAPVAKLAAVLREIRPQVLVTYNEYGGYGHPDHIRAHEVALRAVDAAADGSRWHRVPKVYYSAFPRSLMQAARQMWSDFGFEGEFFSDSDVERIGTPDDEINAVVDVSQFVDRKFAALEAHRTQLGTIAPFLQIPQDIRAMAMGAEHYVLARTELARPQQIESDLFEGL
jgi:N-acetyl-1-D-myo-inositol-2-amino-2-deoxy-alpha-D-glucopyranoside deacetylase